MNALKAALTNALGQDTVQKIEAKSQAVAYFDIFPNNRRRAGVNPRTQKEFEDSHLQGRITLPLARMKQLVAECEVKGHDNLQVYTDLWFQHDGSGAGPMITGQARNVVPDKKRFVPEAQAKAPAQGSGEPTGDEIAQTTGATDDTVTP